MSELNIDIIITSKDKILSGIESAWHQHRSLRKQIEKMPMMRSKIFMDAQDWQDIIKYEKE